MPKLRSRSLCSRRGGWAPSTLVNSSAVSRARAKSLVSTSVPAPRPCSAALSAAVRACSRPSAVSPTSVSARGPGTETISPAAFAVDSPCRSTHTSCISGFEDLAGVEVAAGVVVGEQSAHHARPDLPDVLDHPGAVLNAHPVVVGDARAEIDEGLLHGVLRVVVLIQRRLVARVREGEGEVQAGAAVIAVRHVAEHEARPVGVPGHLVEGVVDRGVDLVEVRPGRPGLADVPEDLVVHQEVAQVGGVELLLVIDRTGAGPQCDAAVAGDDLLDDRLLPLDVGLGALEADVGDAHLLG